MEQQNIFDGTGIYYIETMNTVRLFSDSYEVQRAINIDMTFVTIGIRAGR